MKYEILHECPVCNNELSISRLKCHACASSIEGDFRLDSLSKLNPNQKNFVVAFLRNRGNIKEMEKEFEISYPTVRARLDEILSAMGEKSNSPTRKEILEMLSKGIIDAEEAKRMLEEN